MREHDTASPHALGVVALSADRDGEQVLTSSIDGTVALWHWTDGRLVSTHSTTVDKTEVGGAPYGTAAWASALHPLGDVFAVAGEGLALALFSAAPASFGEGIARFAMEDSDREGYAMKLVFVRTEH